MKKTKMAWLLSSLLAASIVLVACGNDTTLTSVSQTARPISPIVGANINNDKQTGIPTDPTRSGTQVAGATATPLPPTPTPRPPEASPSSVAQGNATVAATVAGGAGSSGVTPGTAGSAAGGTGGGGGAVAAGDATAGLRVFNASQCGTCHTNGGRVAGIGPKLANTTRDEAYIRNILRNGKGAMPAYTTQQVNDTQLNDLVAYIQNLR